MMIRLHLHYNDVKVKLIAKYRMKDCESVCQLNVLQNNNNNNGDNKGLVTRL